MRTEGDCPTFPFPLLPSSFPSNPLSSNSPSPFLCLKKEGPLNGLGSAVSSPSGVEGGAVAKIKFGANITLKYKI